MLKKFVAVCRDKQTKKITVIRSEYETKKAFREDIKLNGYSLKYNYIFTESEYMDFENGVGEITAKIEKKIENAHFNSVKWNYINKANRKLNSDSISPDTVNEIATTETNNKEESSFNRVDALTSKYDIVVANDFELNTS